LLLLNYFRDLTIVMPQIYVAAVHQLLDLFLRLLVGPAPEIETSMMGPSEPVTKTR
jgi:hypothetical protein